MHYIFPIKVFTQSIRILYNSKQTANKTKKLNNQPMKTLLLENLDLSANELKVMNVLMELKLPQNVTFIANQVGIPRTTTLYILNNFQKRKLAIRKTILTGRKRYKKRFHWRKTHITVI